jgi:hypothetical protein
METHKDVLLRARASCAAQLPRGTHVFPTTFDAADPDATGYPRMRSWRWDSARDTLCHFKASGVMMRLPLFWQVEPHLFEAAQASDAFVFVNDAANMPLGAAAIRSANIDLVVTHEADAAQFSAYLHAARVSLPAWLVIHSLSSTPPAVPPLMRGSRVAREIHLFPGVPLFTQCAALADAQSSSFHAADGFECVVEDSAVLLSGTAHDIVPLERFRSPLHMKESGTCACGKLILSA